MPTQNGLPGGALGEAISTLNRNDTGSVLQRSATTPAPSLKHTTVRWHTGPNAAGDPTTGWYILSHENHRDPKIAARTGPVCADNLYRRLFELHGADLDSSNVLTPTFNERDERVNRIIEEAHVQRLHEAARRWNFVGSLPPPGRGGGLPTILQAASSCSFWSVTDCFDPPTQVRGIPVTGTGMLSGLRAAPRMTGCRQRPSLRSDRVHHARSATAVNPLCGSFAALRSYG